MTSGEMRASLALAGIYMLRMLGFFMILPVFSLYAKNLDGYTPLLMGLAVGAYGLTQALLQIPFGLLSDRIGRRPVIVVGLIIFAAGSVLAAQAETLEGVILGRALQGCGAIAAVLMALAADLTREEHRSKAMAIIGMSIGMAFALALVIGPVLNTWIGIPGIFWLTAVLAVLGIGVLFLGVPQAVSTRVHRDAEVVPSSLLSILKDRQLLRLDAGILILHMIITATFLALPFALRDEAGLSSSQHSYVYLVVLLLSVLAMLPFLITAERKQRVRGFFVAAIAVLALGQFGLMWFHQSVLEIGIFLWIFFSAFNYLEANLPALVTRLAPADKKGTAMGVYSSSQFTGAFAGGALGGWVLGEYGLSGVFALSGSLAVLWLFLAIGMKSPLSVSSYVLRVTVSSAAQAQDLSARLIAVEGVSEAVVVVEDGMAYLKVQRRQLDHDALQALSTPGS
ncbi:MAG: MFS transporter [Gammaproteobacteria bacterium]|nr:MAG: MFS transporter [Gammaproteobacteria bacterium]